MARLGSVLGGILAELARAQVISDQLTRDLVEEYQDDTILSTLAVPRVTLGDVDITLRFTVEDIEEEPEGEVNVDDLRARLSKDTGEKVVLSTLSGFRFTKEEQAKVLAVFKEAGSRPLGVPTTAGLTNAVNGNLQRAVDAMVKPALEVFDKLPVELRRKIGNKDTFSLNIRRASTAHLETVIKNSKSTADAKAALGSRINVAVTRAALPDDPGQTQELRLTLRSGDLDLVVADFQGASDGDQEG